MAFLGDDAGVSMLVRAGADLNSINTLGNTPMHEAVSSRQTSAAKALRELGCDLTLTNLDGLSALDMVLKDGYRPMLDLFRAA
jgi:ankyrin repeat protein